MRKPIIFGYSYRTYNNTIEWSEISVYYRSQLPHLIFALFNPANPHFHLINVWTR